MCLRPTELCVQSTRNYRRSLLRFLEGLQFKDTPYLQIFRDWGISVLLRSGLLAGSVSLSGMGPAAVA